MTKNNPKKNRTEAILSVIIATALVLTLALTVSKNISKGDLDNHNIVDLNETKDSLVKNEPATKAPAKNPVIPQSETLPDEEVITPTTSSETLLENTTTESTQPARGQATDPVDIAVDAADSITSNLSFNENSALYWPVIGDVVLPFNMDNTIWFPTLGEYKCNSEIYISSEVGTKISSACNGVVESITQNEETGTNITLSAGNGYLITYGSVDSPQFVKGDIVKIGDTIGTVAAPTIYYSKEGSGLHFSVTHNGEPVDPMLFFE